MSDNSDQEMPEKGLNLDTKKSKNSTKAGKGGAT